MIETIIAERADFLEICDKVSIVAHSFGTNESLIALNNSEAPKYVDKLINITPCAIPNITFFPSIPPSRRRNLLSASEESDLKQAAKNAKAVLGEELYREFYLALRERILDDVAAWNADWETIFNDVLEPFLD